ncbi:MAG TPA: class I SAM-dependent methyltransferase [Candidatus Saccharimonadales bacterium]|nr:class I SAM-dependent methyltransferase [Candidatus Saccharimonadales bacterium]
MANRERSTQRRLLVAVFLAAVFALASASPEEIARLQKLMGWKAGQTIADVGAGAGEIGFAAAKAAGERGRVYLTELDEKKTKELEEEVRIRGLKNVTVVQAAVKETKLPEGCCDAIVLRRVYHHLTAPADMDASLLRSLKPGGELAVIDFPPRKWLSETEPVEGVPANRGGHGIPEKIVVDELKAAGFRIEKVVEDWPEESYCVVARRGE